MPDNPQPAPDRDIDLPGHGVLALTGRDAVAFAQAQFMNDAAALEDGSWQWNGWLTPKGRVIALFALLRLDPATLWLLLPDGDAPGFAARLQGYVFRSRVLLAPLRSRVSGRFASPARATGNRLERSAEGAVELDMGGDGGPRTLSIGASHAIADHHALARWNAADLLHGLPRLRGAQVETWTPQQLSLERLRAFSVKKGCYPGQEIVARTHFLGHAKRGLGLFHADGPVADGARVEAAGSSIGVVVCGHDGLVLAVVPHEATRTALRADAATLVPTPLSAGLAR